MNPTFIILSASWGVCTTCQVWGFLVVESTPFIRSNLFDIFLFFIVQFFSPSGFFWFWYFSTEKLITALSMRSWMMAKKFSRRMKSYGSGQFLTELNIDPYRWTWIDCLVKKRLRQHFLLTCFSTWELNMFLKQSARCLMNSIFSLCDWSRVQYLHFLTRSRPRSFWTFSTCRHDIKCGKTTIHVHGWRTRSTQRAVLTSSGDNRFPPPNFLHAPSFVFLYHQAAAVLSTLPPFHRLCIFFALFLSFVRLGRHLGHHHRRRRKSPRSSKHLRAGIMELFVVIDEILARARLRSVCGFF